MYGPTGLVDPIRSKYKVGYALVSLFDRSIPCSPCGTAAPVDEAGK